MSVPNRCREQWQTFLKMTPKEKISHIFYYYKVLIFAVLFSALFIGWTAYMESSEKESVLNGILLNTYVTESSLEEHLIDELKLDTSTYTVDLNTSFNYSGTDDYSDYEDYMNIIAQLSTGYLDFMTGDLESMLDLAYKGFFPDLTEILSEEVSEAWAPYFLYIDLALLAEDDLSGIEFPDCRNPDSMEDPIPVLIDMSACDTVLEDYGHPEDMTIALAIPLDAPNLDNLMTVLMHLNK